MLGETELKNKQKDKSDRWRKRSKILNEVKPFENISKNLQSVLDISPV